MRSQVTRNIIGITLLVIVSVLYLVFLRWRNDRSKDAVLILTTSTPTPSMNFKATDITYIQTASPSPFPTLVKFASVTPVGWTPSPTPYGWSIAKDNQSAVDFTLTDLDGKFHNLRDYRNKRIILNFWASWCVPCRSEASLLESTYERLQQEEPDVIVIGVNFGESRVAAKQFADEFKLTFPILLDTDQSVSALYAITALPTTIFIAPDGTERFHQFGPVSEEILKSNLDAMPTTLMHSDTHGD